MTGDIDSSKPSGWDAADALAAGWTTADFIAWAKPRARLVYSARPPSPEPPPMDEPPPSGEPAAPDGASDVDVAAWPFRVLGYNRGQFFYLPRGAAQVVTLAASQHRAENLMMLADLSFWEINFPSRTDGANWKGAANALIRIAQRSGIFATHNRIRGRGAWLDKGRAVFHTGDHLIVDGEPRHVTNLATRHVYEEDESLDVDMVPALSGKQAIHLLEICKDFRWEHPMSAYLLAGWLVTAPVCGVLPWRPHLWITGPSGSGKTTVIREIIARVIGRIAVKVVGPTTEAAIRGLLKYDARPVIFDEAEPKDSHNQGRIRAIIDLARVAASEADGMIYKATRDQNVNGYPIRSMFCFGSINPGLESFADESRFTQLALAKNDPRDDEEKALAQAHYEQLVARITTTLTPDYINGLLFRALDNLAALHANIDTFTTAAAAILGNRRLGDQLGPMLAGCYLLHKTDSISPDDALAWVKARDWEEHSAKGAVRDQTKLLHTILQHHVRFAAGNGGTLERSIGELIAAAYRPDDDSCISGGTAHETLMRYGLRPDSKGVHISSTHTYIKKILQGSEWAMGWRRALLALDGAAPSNGGKNIRFGGSGSTPAVLIPLAHVLGEG